VTGWEKPAAENCTHFDPGRFVGKRFVATGSTEPPPAGVSLNNAAWFCAGLVSSFENPATEIKESRTNLRRSMTLLLYEKLCGTRGG
jgi:hypothetical protein